MCSDGLLECPDPQGRALEAEGLCRLVAQAAHLSGPRFMAALEAGLAAHAGSDSFPDDASAVLIEFHGAGG